MKAKYMSFGTAVWLIASALSMQLAGCDENSNVEEAATVSKVEAEKHEEVAEKKPDDQGESGKTAKESQSTAEPKGKLALEKTVQPGVDASIGEKVDEKRDDISEEAQAALQETENALRSLDEKKPKKALEALERVTGKLELLLARKPELSLAPTGVHVVTHDVIGTLDEIEAMREQAEDLLEDGEVQRARGIIAGLASEMIIGVTNIPLASYPEAIKAVSPLIDEGKIEEAKVALQAALNTLVVTEHVIPIPILRAEQMLMKAEPLAEKKNRSQDEKQELEELLENARYHIELAKALGYGDKNVYEEFFDQIKEIEEKTADKKAGKGYFDGIRQSLSKFRKSIFE
jgi:hypothetical protein